MGLNDQVSSFEVYDRSDCNVQPTRDEWRATYFNDKELTNQCGRTTTFDDAYVLKVWGDEGPAPGCNTDNWSARFVRLFDFSTGTYTFNLGSDDWGRIKIDGEPVVNNWQGAGQHYASRALSDGTYEIAVEFADATGAARLSAWWWGPGYVTPREEREPDRWYAQYWGNREIWWEPVALVNEGTGPLSHSWGSGGPGFGLPDDRFSGRFEREASFDCGLYRFDIHTDDGVRFWIDERLMLDKWFDQVGSYEVFAILAEGNHELRVEHFENSGNASISLDWSAVLTCPLPDPQIYFPVIRHSAVP